MAQQGTGAGPRDDGSGIYSATYSGIPVYEFQFGLDQKEHVMRRRHDDWINATHILKAAGFDKPARTRILEREVQKDKHEKVQGGYGKYQGTWIPLPAAHDLAVRNLIYDRIKPIFEYEPGDESPPPAPRHVSKPKAPKAKPALPKWNGKAAAGVMSTQAQMGPVAVPQVPDDYSMSDSMALDHVPDNSALMSALAEENRMSAGERKRKREEMMQDILEQQHSLYSDELLDYFLLSGKNNPPAFQPTPPPDFRPNWVIDGENHTAIHWASAMGDVDVIRQLKHFGANIDARNIRGETPLMRAVNFSNAHEKQTFPAVMEEMFETVHARDADGATVIHHAAVMKNSRIYNPACARYYMDIILNSLEDRLDPDLFRRILDAQDRSGNTALHLAAQAGARKCIRSLLGRHAATDLPNHQGVLAETLIRDSNAAKKSRRPHQRSSSPFGPESAQGTGYYNAPVAPPSPSHESDVPGVVENATPVLLAKVKELAESFAEHRRQVAISEEEAKAFLEKQKLEVRDVIHRIGTQSLQLEPEEVATRHAADANRAKHQVREIISRENRLHVQRAEAAERDTVPSDPALIEMKYQLEESGLRLELSKQLRDLMYAQHDVETDYVNALSMVGTGDKVDKYRKLLVTCLGGDEGSLDANLDSVVNMVEEQSAALQVDRYAIDM